MPLTTVRQIALLEAAMILAIGSAGCSTNESEQSTEVGGRPSVFVVNYPLMYFAERIGGEGVDVHLPVPAGADPAYWQPEAETIVEYQRADLILLNGAHYAGWVERATLPSSKFVNTAGSFRDQYLTIESSITHQHGPQGDHSHREIAFTTWLDPMLAIEQGRVILEAFSNAWPDQAASFEAKFSSLEQDLRALDAELERFFDTMHGRPMLASHPVYQYLTGRYDLDLISVHWEPDEHPADDEWAYPAWRRGEGSDRPRLAVPLVQPARPVAGPGRGGHRFRRVCRVFLVAAILVRDSGSRRIEIHRLRGACAISRHRRVSRFGAVGCDVYCGNAASP